MIIWIVIFMLYFVPGEYHVFIDCIFEQTEEEMLQLLKEESDVAAFKKEATHSSHQADLEVEVAADTPVTRVLLQVSTTAAFELKSIDRESSMVTRMKKGNLESIVVGVQKWPFLLESQSEIASRELISMLTKLKDESEVLGVKFISLLKKYKSLGAQIKYHLEDS